MTPGPQLLSGTRRSSQITKSVGMVSGIFGCALVTAWRTDTQGAVDRTSPRRYFGC